MYETNENKQKEAGMTNLKKSTYRECGKTCRAKRVPLQSLPLNSSLKNRIIQNAINFKTNLCGDSNWGPHIAHHAKRVANHALT